jgi:hypothetical protein
MINFFETPALEWVAPGARRLANDGHLAEGYCYLAECLRAARAAAAVGKPWAQGVIALYRLAVSEYIACYGVCLD